MNRERQELKPLINDWVDSESRRLASHPMPDELRRYVHGDTPPEQKAAIQDHLVVCRRCADLVLAEAELAQLTTPVRADVSDHEIDTAWQQIKPRLGPDVAPAASREVFGRTSLPLRATHAWMAAAALLIAVGGLSAWVWTLSRENRRLTLVSATENPGDDRTASDKAAAYEQQIAELRQQLNALSMPQPNVLIVDLYPPGATRAAGARRAIVDVPTDTNLLAIIMNTDSPGEYPEYRVELLQPAGTRIWQGEGLRKTAFGNFTIMVPRRVVPAGEYRLQLIGIRDGKATRVGNYVLLTRDRP